MPEVPLGAGLAVVLILGTCHSPSFWDTAPGGFARSQGFTHDLQQPGLLEGLVEGVPAFQGGWSWMICRRCFPTQTVQ